MVPLDCKCNVSGCDYQSKNYNTLLQHHAHNQQDLLEFINLNDENTNPPQNSIGMECLGTTVLNYACRSCKEVFKSKNELMRHEQNQHSKQGKRDLSCKYCDFIASSALALNNHCLLHTKPGLNRCYVPSIQLKVAQRDKDLNHLQVPQLQNDSIEQMVKLEQCPLSIPNSVQDEGNDLDCMQNDNYQVSNISEAQSTAVFDPNINRCYVPTNSLVFKNLTFNSENDYSGKTRLDSSSDSECLSTSKAGRTEMKRELGKSKVRKRNSIRKNVAIKAKPAPKKQYSTLGSVGKCFIPTSALKIKETNVIQQHQSKQD
jgi:hypothetical protein